MAAGFVLGYIVRILALPIELEQVKFFARAIEFSILIITIVVLYILAKSYYKQQEDQSPTAH